MTKIQGNRRRYSKYIVNEWSRVIDGPFRDTLMQYTKRQLVDEIKISTEVEDVVV